MDDVQELLARYRDTLAEMHEARIDTGGRPKRWNRLVDRNQAVHLTLRQTPEGRAGIAALMTDERTTVRSWAASHALAWGDADARAVLEALRDGRFGLVSVSAKYTLIEFDAGRLDMTWTPT